MEGSIFQLDLTRIWITTLTSRLNRLPATNGGKNSSTSPKSATSNSNHYTHYTYYTCYSPQTYRYTPAAQMHVTAPANTSINEKVRTGTSICESPIHR